MEKNGETPSSVEKVRNFYNDARQFFREVMVELGKVTFPTRQETMGSTVVVLVLTILMAVYLGLSDWLLSAVVRYLLRSGA
jgi:preprotein translocase subunit SecE